MSAIRKPARGSGYRNAFRATGQEVANDGPRLVSRHFAAQEALKLSRLGMFPGGDAFG